MDVKTPHMSEKRCKNKRFYYLPTRLRVTNLADYQRCLGSLLKVWTSGSLPRPMELDFLKAMSGFLQFYSFLNNSDAHSDLGVKCQGLNFLRLEIVYLGIFKSPHLAHSVYITQQWLNIHCANLLWAHCVLDTVLPSEERQHNPGLC